MIKKIFLFTATLLLTSCTLFLEDYYNKNDVPKHTGVGYDAPVTESTDDYDLTYQFNSNVRQLTPETQRYITDVQSVDESNMVQVVSFRKDTPANLLPRIGEVITCTESELFPYGIAANVVRREETDDTYQFVTSFASMREVFKKLELQGTLSADGFEETEEEEDPNAAKPSRARAVARAEEAVEKDDNFSWNTTTKQLSFTIPGLPIKTGSEKLGLDGDWELTMPSSKNTAKYTFTFEVKLTEKDDEFKSVKIIAVKENNFNVHFHGKAEVDETLLETKKFKFKMDIGPVLFTGYVKGSLNLVASLEGDFDYTHNTAEKTSLLFETDPLKVSMPDKGRVTKDEKTVDAEFKGKLEEVFALQLALGLYDVVHFREDVSFVIGTSSQAQFNLTNGSPISIVNHPSVNSYMRVDLAAQAFMVSGLPGAVKSAVETLGIAYNNTLPMFALASKFLDFKTPVDMLKDLADDILGDSEDEIAITDAAKASIPIKSEYLPWFPKMNDNSLKIVPTWSKKMDAVSYNAEFAIDSIGLISLFKDVYPCLQIRKNGKAVETLRTMDYINASTKKGRVFEFGVDDLELDQEYEAYPCYALTFGGNPIIFDKPLAFNTAAPRVEIMGSTFGVPYKAVFIADDYMEFYARDVELHFIIYGHDHIDEVGVKDLATGDETIVASRLLDKKEYPRQLVKPQQMNRYTEWTFQFYSTKKSVNAALQVFAILKDTHERVDYEAWKQTVRLVQ